MKQLSLPMHRQNPKPNALLSRLCFSIVYTFNTPIDILIQILRRPEYRYNLSSEEHKIQEIIQSIKLMHKLIFKPRILISDIMPLIIGQGIMINKAIII